MSRSIEKDLSQVSLQLLSDSPFVTSSGNLNCMTSKMLNETACLCAVGKVIGRYHKRNTSVLREIGFQLYRRRGELTQVPLWLDQCIRERLAKQTYQRDFFDRGILPESSICLLERIAMLSRVATTK